MKHIGSLSKADCLVVPCGVINLFTFQTEETTKDDDDMDTDSEDEETQKKVIETMKHLCPVWGEGADVLHRVRTRLACS